jgi:hypothetical protein
MHIAEHPAGPGGLGRAMTSTHITRFLRLRAPLLARMLPMLVVPFLFAAREARASERWATLEAIHRLENPSDSEAPGSFGELGAYQFREETWKMHTSAPFTRALDRRSSDAVAVKHYDWIKSELERRGIVATPYKIALAWNGGIKAVVAPSPRAVVADYASRAANIVAELEHSELAYAR